ncbi:CYTH and CHAD domain-containing protein [Novispirillum itersonii]|uniref:CYTH and CHAD domain-containing protein n=1 Tax=Novispirillum itersonii TaxID=189 RepID=UPI00036CE7B7|nr:CYTH and CHAD domain-containing protein [Novispirillum itersonii]
MATELELKLDLDPALIDKVRRHGLIRRLRQGKAISQDLRSVYFDTSDHTLRQIGATVRIRHVGKRRIQNVKMRRPAESGAHFNRLEWEHDVFDDAPALVALNETALPQALPTPLTDLSLQPQFATQFRRSSYLLATEDAEVELSIDHGGVETDGRQQPFCELELELKRGTPQALFTFARELASTLPVRIGTVAKSERGYRLLTGELPGVKKAKAPPLTPDMTTAQALQIIGRSCLSHLLANQDALQKQRSPESVHQMRVAMRRFRSALTVFRPALSEQDPQLAAIRDHARWIAETLGEARDLDVFLAEGLSQAEDALLAAEVPAGLFTPLRQELSARRTAAYERAISTAASPAFTLACLDLAEWIETGAWLTAEDETAALRQQPICDFAATVLAARHRKVLRRGQHFATLSMEARHRARIEVKKLRYSVDFFGALYSGKRAAAFADGLADLQEHLGHLNDGAVALALIQTLAQQVPACALPGGLVGGWHAAARADALEQARRSWKTFRTCRPFWK